MTSKLSTTVRNIKSVPNQKSAELIRKFFEFMRANGTSERYQNNNLKALMSYCKFLGNSISLDEVNSRNQIISFLDTKIKDIELDPDKRWITTWNDYLGRIKFFFRWLYNFKDTEDGDVEFSSWETPDFVKIKKKKTKRISPYLENELWEKEELLNVIKYEAYRRNKAILSLLWDLDARPHEVTLLKIKHIRLRENYGEGEIPHEAKTGTGPILLTMSFPYVRDWLNEHPFKNEPDARLICNLNNGSPITPDNIDKVMKQLRIRIIRLLKNGEIQDPIERENLEFLLITKKWNPYCIRHSAITADSDYLPEYALKKKVRWSMNSKQGSRYIKRRMGSDLTQKILAHNGISTSEQLDLKKPAARCPRCQLINAFENKYCSKCSYPLVPEAYDELKSTEHMRMIEMEREIESLKESNKEILECLKYPEKLSEISHER